MLRRSDFWSSLATQNIKRLHNNVTWLILIATGWSKIRFAVQYKFRNRNQLLLWNLLSLLSCQFGFGKLDQLMGYMNSIFYLYNLFDINILVGPKNLLFSTIFKLYILQKANLLHRFYRLYQHGRNYPKLQWIKLYIRKNIFFYFFICAFSCILVFEWSMR